MNKPLHKKKLYLRCYAFPRNIFRLNHSENTEEEG